VYLRVGIYPWYAVHERHHGYEPLFVYDRWYYGRHDPAWEISVRRGYEYRVTHIDARPPHTYVAAMSIGVRTPGASFTLVAPISHVAARPGGAMHYEHISAERREHFVQTQHEIRHVQAERRTSEIKAGVQARAGGGQPVRTSVHTSAMTTSRQAPPAAAHAGTGHPPATGSAGAAGRTPAAGANLTAAHTGTGPSTARTGAAAPGRPGALGGAAPQTRKDPRQGKGGNNPRDRDKGGR
jgi:hypothetical protein